MRHRQFNIFVILMLIACMALLGIFSAGAQQQQADKSAAKAGQAKEEEPVAITPKIAAEKAVEAPRTPTPEEFGNFRFPIINNKSEIAFMALYANPNGLNGAGQSIFVRQPDGKWKITREGDKAANLPEGIYSFSMPTFNDNGDLTFYGSFGSPTARQAVVAPADPNDPVSHAPVQRNGALYVKTAQGLKSLVKLGEEVPNMPSHFSGFSNPSTNTKGTTAFIGTYSDPDGRGLFLVEQGKLRLVVRSGQKVGDTNPGETFSEHYYPAPINDRGEVAFLSRIGGDASGIFVHRPSGLEQIAYVGKPTPIKGANYLGFGNRTPSLNSKGDVAFVAFYDGPDNGRALFFKGATGPVQVIARSGEKAGDAGGEFRDFLAPAVNARGDIAFIGRMVGRAQGIFLKTAKGIETVALLDQKIPGGKGEMEVFNNFTQPSINDKGEVVFYGQMKNAEVGIFYRDEKGVLHTVVRRGEKMPK